MEQGKYNLRTRAVPVSASRAVRTRPGSPSSSEEGSAVGDRPEGVCPRSYSNVVASRPASPARQSGGQNVVPVSHGAEHEANVPVQRTQDTTFDEKGVVSSTPQWHPRSDYCFL